MARSVPVYVTKTMLERDEFAFVDRPIVERRYDSSLSEPGRLCRRCRTFVAGDRDRVCPECGPD